ncbi:MAG: hypothetical protein GTN69_10585 [Armatimonadetes bacterium]|nr:hypothetical protein [Armatimonadota bacterium]
MGVATTLDRVAVALDAATAHALDAGPDEPASELGDAYKQGVNAVVDYMRSLLSVDGQRDPATGDLFGDAYGFCQRQCAYGQEKSPGEHLRCATCQLKKHTIDGLTEAAETAAREATETP